MNMNYKTLVVVLFVILAFAYIPLLVAAQPDISTVLSAIAGLSTQISRVEDNILVRLASIDQKLSAMETTLSTATGANIQALVPLLQATIALIALTLVLTIVNIYLLFRRTTPPERKPTPPEKKPE